MRARSLRTSLPPLGGALAAWAIGVGGLAGCSDYGVKGEPAEPIATLSVTPEAVALTGVCADTPADITLTSVGTGPVEITDLALEGDGWALPAVTLPFTLDPRESRVLTLAGGPGEATLRVTSTDAAAPVVEVPLRQTVNEHPVAMVTAPYEDEQVPPDGVLVLQGVVSDEEQRPDELLVTWTSSLVGTVGTSVPDSAGRVSFEWAAEDRASGPQTIQILATDTCGAIGETTLYYCQDGPWTYDPVTFSAWTEAGAATWTEAGLALGGVADSSGAMFAASEILDAGELTASLTFEAGAVNGLALVLLDTDRRVTYLGGDGCGLGYGGGVDCAVGDPLPGWAVEVDLVADSGVDTQAGPHVAFVVDGDVANPRIEAPVGALGSGEHEITVDVRAPRVTVTLDGAVVLDGDVPDTLDFRGVLGVTMSAGAEAGEVRVPEATFTDFACE